MEILPFLILLVNILLLVGVVLTKTGFSENIGLEFDLISTFILVFNTSVQIILYAWLYYVNKNKASKETTYLDLEKGSFGRAWLLFSMAFNLQTLVILIINAVTTQGLSLMIILFITAFGILTLILYGVEFFRLFQQGQKNVDETRRTYFAENIDFEKEIEGNIPSLEDIGNNLDNPFELKGPTENSKDQKDLFNKKFLLSKDGFIIVKHKDERRHKVYNYPNFVEAMLGSKNPEANRIIPFTKYRHSGKVVINKDGKISYIDRRLHGSNIKNFPTQFNTSMAMIIKGETGINENQGEFDQVGKINVLSKGQKSYFAYDENYDWLIYFTKSSGGVDFVEAWDFDSTTIGSDLGRESKPKTAQPKGKKPSRGAPKGAGAAKKGTRRT